jgi:hypothetical protein
VLDHAAALAARLECEFAATRGALEHAIR